MSVIRDVVEGFASGWLSVARNYHSQLPSNITEGGRIETLCQELGWRVDEQEGQTIELHFNDPTVGVRKVIIFTANEPVVTLVTFSFAIMAENNLPAQVISYLLSRNTIVPFGAWCVSGPVRDGKMTFVLQYKAIVAGLTASMFKNVCESMIREAVEFDGKMRSAGLMR